MDLTGDTTPLNEVRRTYLYDKRDIEVVGVTELTVRPSGSHRLRTRDGRLHIMAAGWLAIAIEDATEEWTV